MFFGLLEDRQSASLHIHYKAGFGRALFDVLCFPLCDVGIPEMQHRLETEIYLLGDFLRRHRVCVADRGRAKLFYPISKWRTCGFFRGYGRLNLGNNAVAAV